MKIYIKILVIILVVTPFISIFSQSPFINVFPDSITLLMQSPNATIIDSFKITNAGSDTLNYQISFNQIADTSDYHHIYDNPTLIESDSTIRVTIFSPSHDFILLQIKYPLLIQIPTHIEFFLFECLSLTGDYQKIYSKVHLIDTATFDHKIMSDYLNIPLHSDRYYAIGIAWDNLVQSKYFGNGSSGSDGLRLEVFGSGTKSNKYPTDSILTVPEVSPFFIDEIEITGGIPFWLQLLTDSSGSIVLGDTNIVKFSAQDPGYPIGWFNLINYFKINSNDPIDSIKIVSIYRNFITDVEDQNYDNLLEFRLEQNYPNPFNPKTIIEYNLPKCSVVKIIIYDVIGNEIMKMVNEEQSIGRHKMIFNGKNLSSGIYLYHIQADEYSETKKMLLLK